MPDYDQELRFGAFLTPSAQSPQAVVGLAQLAEELGLDLVSFQDHPYQPAFLDTWTLLSYVAAATARIRLAPNVLNLPLRPPAVVARAAASLDLLSGGRVELGLGAGGFWDAIEAMGGPRRTPGEAVHALAEAIKIIHQLWDVDSRGGARFAGEHYRLSGAKRGPAPGHDIEIWVGALKPRMLRLVGRLADGWLPSSGYLPPDQLAAASAEIDRAAVTAGRAPRDIRRLYNLSGSFGARTSGFLHGPPAQWVDELTKLTLRHGISSFILASDDPQTLTTFATAVIPGVRAAVAAGRGMPTQPSPPSRRASVAPAATQEQPDGSRNDFPVVSTPDDGTRLVGDLWDGSTRPSAPPQPARHYSARELAGAQHLVDIHNHLRAELDQIRELVRQVLDGTGSPSQARSAINDMTVRQNNWTVGAYCASYCRLVTTHHSIEDQGLFPQLRRAEPALAPVLERLHEEHEVIHGVLESVDRALVTFVGPAAHGEDLQRSVDQLSDTLLSHLSYEERELVEPLARSGALI